MSKQKARGWRDVGKVDVFQFAKNSRLLWSDIEHEERKENTTHLFKSDLNKSL